MRTRVLASLRLLVALAAGPMLLTIACGSSKHAPDSTPTPTPGPGARVLSISADPRLIPTPTTQDYLDAITLAYGAGVRGQFDSFTWSSIEPTNGQLSVAKIHDGVTFDHSQGFTRVLVGLQCINTTAKEVPADLQGVAWDDPAMEARFHAVIDAIVASNPGTIDYLSIGNEVDVYLGATNLWTQYGTFYADAVSYVHSKMPGTKVGVTFTFDGANGPAAAEVGAFEALSDIAVFTYYPLGTNFVPRGAGSAATDLPKMVTLAGAKPVVVQELGYPADSTVLQSSEQEQADFITGALTTWSSIGGDAMPFLNVFLMHDFTPQMCDQFAQYYGDPNDANFKAYLCTIGLRQDDGTPKAAWNAFVTAAANTGLP